LRYNTAEERMQMSRARIAIPQEALAEFCHRNHIRRLSLFGSVLREDFTPESDVDVLVEFEPEAQVSLLGEVRIEREMGEILGRKVDLVSRKYLSKYFRDEVFAEEEMLYVAA
jgi:predicted nucleotidyltransferase